MPKKKDESEQSSGYWQHSKNQNKSGNPNNKTIFYDFGKPQNINDVIQNKQFTDFNFVFFTRNNIPKYICLLYSIKFVSKNKFFDHFKKQCWKSKSPARIPRNTRCAFYGIIDNGINNYPYPYQNTKIWILKIKTCDDQNVLGIKI